MNSKSNFVCCICSKLLKSPICFPCGCTVCGEHLDEKEAQKTSTIKCNACNIEYNLKNKEFKPNKILENMLSQGVHLTDKEKSAKLNIEQEMGNLYRICDEMMQRENILEVDVYHRFQELIRKIDKLHEEAKALISDLCMEFNSLTKQIESHSLAHLKRETPNMQVRCEYVKLKQERNISKETIRDFQLLTKTAKPIKSKQDEYMKDSVFGKGLFGELNLVKASTFERSKIVSNEQWFDLMSLCEFSPSDKWILRYRASEDGFGARSFHSKCDGRSSSLTIIKTRGSSNIFGGYTNVAWGSSFKFKEDANAFIFSLVNKDNRPVKMKASKPKCAIFSCRSYGPSFGVGDILIASNSNANKDSFSSLGSSYTHPIYGEESEAANSFLAGSIRFRVKDIEVYTRY